MVLARAIVKHGGNAAIRCLSSYSSVQVMSGRGGRSSTSSHTVTIFGATGRMGRFLVNSLGQCGTQMVIPHRLESSNTLYLKVSSDLGQMHFVQVNDFNDEDLLRDCVKYSDVVVNLTGSERSRLHYSMLDSNVTLTHRIARACREMEVPTFIHMSHINANHDSLSEYFRTKALSEEVVLHELPDAAIIIRASDCFHFCDTLTHTLAQNNYKHFNVRKGHTTLYKKGLETFKQPVFGPDVMKGIKNIILMNDEDRRRLYQFYGPQEFSLHELMEEITALTLREYTPADNYLQHLINTYMKDEAYTRMQLISDVITPGLPGLEDVGITPKHLSEVAVAWLRNYRNFWRAWDPVDGKRSDTSGNVLGTGEGF